VEQGGLGAEGRWYNADMVCGRRMLWLSFAIFGLGACGTPADTGPVPVGDDTAAPDDSGAPAPVVCDPVTLSMTDEWLAEVLPTYRDKSHTPAGVAVGDLDGDGWPDALFAYGGGAIALRNDGAGRLVLAPEWTIDGGQMPDASAVALVDLDGDGDLDAFFGRDTDSSDSILVNDGTGRFTTRQVLPNSGGAPSTGSFADFDGDGDLDLFVATTTTNTVGSEVLDGTASGDGCRLYLQGDDGQFADATANLPQDVLYGWTFQGSPIDADGDGDLDIYMANDFGAWLGPNRLLLNDGGAIFTVAEDCGCELEMFGMGAAVGDINGDALPDLYITDIGGPNLLVNAGDGSFYDATLAMGVAIPIDESLTSWGTTFVDINQDSYNDLAVTYGQLGQSEVVDELESGEDWVDFDEQPDVLVVSDGRGGYTRPDTGWNDPSRSRAVSVGDLNRDGRPDLVTAGKYFLRSWITSGGCEPGLQVTLTGRAGNRTGIGTRITVEWEGHRQTQWMLPSTTGSSNAPELFFGLGGATKADRITVTWPDGTVQESTDVPSGPVEFAL